MQRYFLFFFRLYCRQYSGLPYNTWHHIFLSFIVTAATGISFFFSLYLVSFLHINLELTGLLITCFGLGTICGGVIGGRLSDRLTPHFVSFLSLFILFFCYIVILFLKNLEMLGLLLFVMGFFSNSFRTANNAKALSYVKVEKLKAINIMAISYNLGLAVSGVLVSFIGGFGLKNVFIFSSIMLFMAILYLIFTKRCNNRSVILPLATRIENETPPFTEEKAEKSKMVLLIALATLLIFGFYIAQLNTTYPVYLTDQFPRFGLKSFGYLFLLNPIIVIFFQAPIGNSFQHTSKVMIMGGGIFLYSAGLFMLNHLFAMYVLAIFSCLFYTLGEMLFMPRAQLLIYLHGAENKKGSALGLFQSVYSLGIIIGPITGSFIYARLGVTALWDFCGMLGLAALVLCFFYRSRN